MVGPADAYGFYLTAGLGVSPAMTLRSIDAALSRLPLRPTVKALSQLCRLAQHSQRMDPALQSSIARRLLPPRSAANAVRILAGGKSAVLMPQVVVNLAIRALAFCDDNSRSADSTEMDRTLGPLLMALGDHLGSPREHADSFTIELLRLSLLADINADSIWVELAAELFFEILPTLDHPEFVDANAVISMAHGMSLQRFWALTGVNGAPLRTNSGLTDVPVQVDGWNVSTTESERWVDAFSQSIPDARAAALVDIGRGTGWSFECCTDRPLVELTPGRHVPLLPSSLFSQATPQRLFWAVRHPWVAGGGSHTRWSGFFGAGIEQLGRNLVERALPDSPQITERHLQDAGSPSQCDLILDDHTAIALDFVYRQFTFPTVATGDRTRLAKDLRDAVVHKAGQIDRALRFATDRLDFAPDTVTPLVVVGGPFPLTHRLYQAIDGLLPHATFEFIGRDARCRELAVMDMANFAVALDEARATRRTLGEVVRAWQDSPWRHHNFRSWWHEFGTKAPSIRDEWSRRAYMELGLPGPDHDPPQNS